MVGIYGYHGPALLTAVHDAGKAGKMKIVCFDDEIDTLAGIVAGDIYGTIVAKTLGDRLGRPSSTWTSIFTATNRSWPAEKSLLPSQPITKENVANF